MDRSVVVAFEGVSKRFGPLQALDDVTLAIRGPGATAILGPNGAGKSTLLDLAQGLSDPDAGHVSVLGARVNSHSYPRRRVGVVMQREFVMDRVTTAEYAELFAAIYGVAGGRERILREARLEDRARTMMSRLSGGEAARLFAAAATVHDPEVVFLDEPTASLDPENKRRLGAWMKELAKTRTVIVTTHDLREADAFCDDLVFLVGGKLRAAGSRVELAARVPAEARTGHDAEDVFFHVCRADLERVATHDGRMLSP